MGILGIDDDNASKKILLKLDSREPTIVTGFKWVDTDTTLYYCGSASARLSCYATYIDPNEISKNKDAIGTSGIIERTINANGRYFTANELTSYAESLLGQLSKQTNQVAIILETNESNIKFDDLKTALKLTKKIIIDRESCFIKRAEFIITDITLIRKPTV